MSASLEKDLTRHALYRWLPRLSDDEKKAIVDYTDVNLYKLVNRALRSGVENGDAPPFIMDMIDNINSGLRKFKYAKGLIVYRRVSEEEYIFLENNKIMNSFADFKSTTIHKDIAWDFSQDETKHIIIAQLPNFVDGASIAPLSRFEYEKEFLLNKGSQYQVLNKLYDKEKNVKYLFLKVV